MQTRKAHNVTEQKNSGFTFIELMVVTAILTAVSTMVLVSHGKFNSTITLTNATYDAALAVREAQVYGLAVRETNAGSDDFSRGYGMHVDINNSTEYIVFRDDVANGSYDALGDTVIVTQQIGQNNFIGDFCATTPAGIEDCSITSLDITFIRPTPDARIETNVTSGYDSARIVLQSPEGKTREVLVTFTGQISVVNP